MVALAQVLPLRPLALIGRPRIVSVEKARGLGPRGGVAAAGVAPKVARAESGIGETWTQPAMDCGITVDPMVLREPGRMRLITGRPATAGWQLLTGAK